MTIESLTTTIASRGVSLYLEGEALRFRAPKGALTAELKQQIVEHRGEIIAQMRPPAAAKCRKSAIRCDWRDWVDEPAREGRIRTHCGQCGRFIGYRPENLAPGGDRALEPGRHA